MTDETAGEIPIDLHSLFKAETSFVPMITSKDRGIEGYAEIYGMTRDQFLAWLRTKKEY